MTRPWNFAAGPAILPEPVLETAQAELLDWHGSGMSVMEMSHRGKEFSQIIAEAEADLRELLAIPPNYKVLFLQGGATQMFAQIPLNLIGASKSADYAISGSWSKKAYKEAQRVLGAQRARVAGNSEADAFGGFCALDACDPAAAFMHVCTNETIHGVEVFDFAALRKAVPAAVPIVADMSSHMLSRPVDVSQFGLIYGGAQKNVGPSGVTLVIVRDDLLGRAPASLPTVMDFTVEAENGSMLNTPPTFGIYMAGLVFKWLKAQGGLAGIEARNKAKAEALYAAIDGSAGFYRNPVAPANRSRMNVPFAIAGDGDNRLTETFLAESKAAGLLSLKQHKSFPGGGMRASIYNAMPREGLQALVAFMNDFRRRKG
jgi:phosphoserine aminotransferase